MKTLIKKMMVVGVMASMVIACSAEDAELENNLAEETQGLNSSYDFENEDLAGTWNIISMMSTEVPVDLDLNGVSSRDILSETTCFDEIFFTFEVDGRVVTRQSRLDFDTPTGQMACDTKTYEAEYELVGNQLTVKFSAGEFYFTQTRYIDIIEEDGKQYLEMTLSYEEVRQFIIDPDFVSPTGATNVKAVTFLLQKE